MWIRSRREMPSGPVADRCFRRRTAQVQTVEVMGCMSIRLFRGWQDSGAHVDERFATYQDQNCDDDPNIASTMLQILSRLQLAFPNGLSE